MAVAEIILASSSQTRKALLDRLGLDYRCISPDIDESPQNEQHADQLAHRLAYEKAKVISQAHPDAIVIGSDQVAWCLDAPQLFIGKPLTEAAAILQLQAQSAQTVCFSTGLSVQQQSSGFEHTLVEHFQVTFRNLSLLEIQRYVAREQPLQCAGSFMCEGLGISLFEKMHGDDQTTLMGLPLIQLCHLLRKFEFKLP